MTYALNFLYAYRNTQNSNKKNVETLALQDYFATPLAHMYFIENLSASQGSVRRRANQNETCRVCSYVLSVPL